MALASLAPAGAETTRTLVEGSSPDAAQRFVPNSPSVIVAPSADR